MTEIEKPAATTPPAPYRPGLPLAQSLRATFLRFLPASVVSTGAMLTAIFVIADGVSLRAILTIGSGGLAVAGLMTAGYGLGLEAMRRRLYPDAEIDGRRSVIAGLMAPLATFTLLVLEVSTRSVITIPSMFLVGLVIAVLMFFAWLTPTPWLQETEASTDEPTA